MPIKFLHRLIVSLFVVALLSTFAVAQALTFEVTVSPQQSQIAATDWYGRPLWGLVAR